MKGIASFLFAAAAVGAAVPAAASVTSVGGSSARLCFEAADAPFGATQRDLDRCDEALEREALRPYDRVGTYVNRGILKARLGRIDEAIADYDAALAADPDAAEAYLNKGSALLRLDDRWEEAARLFSVALDKGTKKPAVAHLGRGIAQEMGGNLRAAYSDYRQARRLAPRWAEPKAELARFHVR